MYSCAARKKKIHTRTLFEKIASESIKGSYVLKSVYSPWRGQNHLGTRRWGGRSGAHPTPTPTSPGTGTCTVAGTGIVDAAPGSWWPQRVARSWVQWCCAGAAHSPGRWVRTGRTASPVPGARAPSQRRREAALGSCGADSATPSKPPHRPCAAGHTSH